MRTLIALTLCASALAHAQGLHVCQDPVTGKKSAQDFPCKSGKTLSTYTPASPEEQKRIDERARQSKRDFERLRPGTYRPEEYMTAEEFAEWQAQQKEREAERKRIEDEVAIREATRRAAQAEQRALEAERTAQEAKARAAAAEEAARRQPPAMLLAPHTPPVIVPVPVPAQRQDQRHDHRRDPRCMTPDCDDAPSGQSRLSPRPLSVTPPERR